MPNDYWKNNKMVGQNLVLKLMKTLHMHWGNKGSRYMGLYPDGDNMYLTLFTKKEESFSIVAHDRIKESFMGAETGVLKQYIKKHQLSQVPVILILPKQYYDIFMLDDFPGEISDKHNAIKWRLAEYLDYPCEEAIVEYLTLPCKNSKPGKIYALAMQQDNLKACITWARKNNIKLTKIDIWQNAIKNSILGESPDKGTVIVKMGCRKSELVIMRNNEIYFMRDIDVSAKNFKTENTDALASSYDALSLEIQRSIDYCASHIRNPGITQIYINPDIENVLNSQKLEGILGLPVYNLALRQWREQQKIMMPELIAGSAALGGDI
tara:strand:- start:72285 stop:73253 length:969 start_codon:yes stop_codon:yes gene_type:complete